MTDHAEVFNGRKADPESANKTVSWMNVNDANDPVDIMPLHVQHAPCVTDVCDLWASTRRHLNMNTFRRAEATVRLCRLAILFVACVIACECLLYE